MQEAFVLNVNKMPTGTRVYIFSLEYQMCLRQQGKCLKDYFTYVLSDTTRALLKLVLKNHLYEDAMSS